MVTFPFFPDGKLIACWPPGLRLRPSNGWVVLRIKERIWRWLRVHGSTCVIRLLNKHFRPTCRETPVIWIIKPYDRNDMDIFLKCWCYRYNKRVGTRPIRVGSRDISTLVEERRAPRSPTSVADVWLRYGTGLGVPSLCRRIFWIGNVRIVASCLTAPHGSMETRVYWHKTLNFQDTTRCWPVGSHASVITAVYGCFIGWKGWQSQMSSFSKV